MFGIDVKEADVIVNPDKGISRYGVTVKIVADEDLTNEYADCVE